VVPSTHRLWTLTSTSNWSSSYKIDPHSV